MIINIGFALIIEVLNFFYYRIIQFGNFLSDIMTILLFISFYIYRFYEKRIRKGKNIIFSQRKELLYFLYENNIKFLKISNRTSFLIIYLKDILTNLNLNVIKIVEKENLI